MVTHCGITGPGPRPVVGLGPVVGPGPGPGGFLPAQALGATGKPPKDQPSASRADAVAVPSPCSQFPPPHHGPAGRAEPPAPTAFSPVPLLFTVMLFTLSGSGVWGNTSIAYGTAGPKMVCTFPCTNLTNLILSRLPLPPFALWSLGKCGNLGTWGSHVTSPAPRGDGRLHGEWSAAVLASASLISGIWFYTESGDSGHLQRASAQRLLVGITV